MTSTACQGAAMIAEFFVTIVETILAIAENIRNAVQALGVCCHKAGRRFAALSRPMMRQLGILPPSASALHALARKPSRRLMIVDLNDAARCMPLGDIAAAA